MAGYVYLWKKQLRHPIREQGWNDQLAKFNNLHISPKLDIAPDAQSKGLSINPKDLQVHRSYKPLFDYYSYLSERVADTYWQEKIRVAQDGLSPYSSLVADLDGTGPKPVKGVLTDPTVNLSKIDSRINSSKQSLNTTKYQKCYMGVIRREKGD